jgi:hypothetical protein
VKDFSVELQSFITSQIVELISFTLFEGVDLASEGLRYHLESEAYSQVFQMFMGVVGFEEEFLKVSDPLEVIVGGAARSTQD